MGTCVPDGKVPVAPDGKVPVHNVQVPLQRRVSLNGRMVWA